MATHAPEDPQGPKNPQDTEDITQLLRRFSNGENNVDEELMRLVYPELHRLAVIYLRREQRREHTIQPTALVNEFFLKFTEQDRISWKNREQFYGVAAKLMRWILVDYARQHAATKRGGDRKCVSIRNVADFGSQPDLDLLALHDALNKLEELDPDQARIVLLRFFVGCTIEETAELTHTSHATVEREWKVAKAFLKKELTTTSNRA